MYFGLSTIHKSPTLANRKQGHRGEGRTHGDTIDDRFVGFLVVFVEDDPPTLGGSTDNRELILVFAPIVDVLGKYVDVRYYLVDKSAATIRDLVCRKEKRL